MWFHFYTFLFYTSGPLTTPAATEVCSDKMSADVNFVVDSSRSVTAANWEIVKQFMNNVVDKFVIGDNDVSCIKQPKK